VHAVLKSGESGRYGWIVVGAIFLTLGIVYGVWYSCSIFFVAFLREFGRGFAAAAQIFDRTGSYRAALWVAFGLAALAPALLWIVAPRRPHPPPGRRRQ
jgi:hypothetical protein